jgi:glyoxylase-like metal-dependent hydrolase (beta-lactamase superfamily II)
MVKKIIVGVLRTNCYIYTQDNHDCIIIDPGGEEGEILAQLKQLNLVPRGIALTHGHLDHTLAVGNLVSNYRREKIKLPVAINGKDSHYLGPDAESINRRNFASLGFINSEEIFGSSYVPLPEADILLKEGDRVFDTDLKVIYTPGHTEGGVCFYAKGTKILFSGDTLFFEGIGRADLPGGNEELLISSINTKLLDLPTETHVYPGHGPETTIGQEKSNNPFL